MVDAVGQKQVILELRFLVLADTPQADLAQRLRLEPVTLNFFPADRADAVGMVFHPRQGAPGFVQEFPGLIEVFRPRGIAAFQLVDNILLPFDQQVPKMFEVGKGHGSYSGFDGLSPTIFLTRAPPCAYEKPPPEFVRPNKSEIGSR